VRDTTVPGGVCSMTVGCWSIIRYGSLNAR
jgi:hypothetical protein